MLIIWTSFPLCCGSMKMSSRGDMGDTHDGQKGSAASGAGPGCSGRPLAGTQPIDELLNHSLPLLQPRFELAVVSLRDLHAECAQVTPQDFNEQILLFVRQRENHCPPLFASLSGQSETCLAHDPATLLQRRHRGTDRGLIDQDHQSYGARSANGGVLVSDLRRRSEEIGRGETDRSARPSSP